MERNKITYGDRTFTHAEITNLRCYKATSLLSLSLESDTLQFDVERDDTALVDFQKNDKLVYSYNGNTIGTFYLQSVRRIGVTRYRFSAVSVIGILAQKAHTGGIYTGQTVATVIADICSGISYSIKSNLQSITLYGWLPYRNPPESSARDNLAQVLFAIGASTRTSADGILYIEDLYDGISGYINKDSIYTGPSVKYGSKISAVSILEHKYSAGTEQQELFEGTAQDGDIIVFDEPMHSLSASGFYIQDSGANWAKISAGNGVLTGKKYVHNTRQMTKTVNSSAAENVKSIKNATLVSMLNSLETLDRMENYYKCTDVIKEQIVYAAQKPGDVLSVYHPYDKNTVLACLQNADIQASGILAAKVDMLIGFKPIQVVEMVDCREVLTGSGSWTVPAGVTRFTAVLIGGGKGGKAGNKGEDGKSGRTASWTYSLFGSLNYNFYGYVFTECAKGGAGGDPGDGGKVLMQTVQGAVPGSEISFSCGVGGDGADFNADSILDGSEGADTVFGDYSSANGSRSSAGYTDQVTGEVFATIGDVGIAGGDGGGSISVDDFQNPNTDGFFIVGQGLKAGGSVVDENGKTWSGGDWERDSDRPDMIVGKGSSANYDGDLSHGEAEATSASGAPGGAAAGANGGSGSNDGYASAYRYPLGSTSGAATALYAKAKAGSGANGATATLAPKKPTVYGRGGRGGYGGGGGGSMGCGYYGRTASSRVTINGIANPGLAGVGGNGAKGGQGADGCIILYYKKPKS